MNLSGRVWTILAASSLVLTACTVEGDDQQTSRSPENTVEACSDKVDNDLDGYADCADTECQALDICKTQPDDPKTDLDCSDPANADACGAKPREDSEAACSDKVDNDGDGFVDCKDADCARTSVCHSEVTTPENTESACSDKVDNDGDGQIDCADADCASLSVCHGDDPTPENTESACSDKVDNDGDGQIDCADADCASLSVCKSSDKPDDENTCKQISKLVKDVCAGSSTHDDDDKPTSDDAISAQKKFESSCQTKCDDAACAQSIWCTLYTTVDSGEPGIKIAPTEDLKTTEDGGAVLLGVVLTSKPDQEVMVEVFSSNETFGIAQPGYLTFTSDNWNKPQYVTVTGQDDSVENDQVYSIYASVEVGSKAWTKLETQEIQVTHIDNDGGGMPASFVVSPDSLEIAENGVGSTFTVSIGTKPTDDVVVKIASSNEREFTVSPDSLTFTTDNYVESQTVTIKGVADKVKDGNQNGSVLFTVESSDKRFNGFTIENVAVTVKDSDDVTTGLVTLRVMAANTSSGNYQSYDDGEGIRIFKAVKPDIVLIQEFSYGENKPADIETFVRNTFGNEFVYSRGSGSIPNGVISRYPIVETGSWSGSDIPDRKNEWAVIDIPGDKDLLAVSVHLHTKSDIQQKNMDELVANISEKLKDQDYYVVLGGDFNTAGRDEVKKRLGSLFATEGPYPVDQLCHDGTSADRKKPLDWVLASKSFDAFKTGTTIGETTYEGGHVFDARVYDSLNALCKVAPVKADDCGPAADAQKNETNIQHMAVIRDFELTVK